MLDGDLQVVRLVPEHFRWLFPDCEAGSRIWQCLKIVKSRQRLEMSVCAEVGARIEKQVSVFVQDPSLVHTN